MGVVTYSFIIFTSGISAMLLFEGMPRYRFFTPFLPISRVYVLVAFISAYSISLIAALFDVSYYGFIFLGILFLFFIHIRYSNYIAFSLAIFGTFYLYSLVFFSLISPESLVSTLLFIFFLPLCIIGNTYFWEERFPYDLRVLHYSSIVFSMIFTLYSLIFVAWWWVIFFTLSLSVFCLGFLLFLSYFRFRSHT